MSDNKCAFASATLAVVNGAMLYFGKGIPFSRENILELTLFWLPFGNGVLGTVYWKWMKMEGPFWRVIIELTERGYGLQDFFLIHFYSAALWVHSGKSNCKQKYTFLSQMHIPVQFVDQLSTSIAAGHIIVGCLLYITPITRQLAKIEWLNVNRLYAAFGILAMVYAFKLTDDNRFAIFAPLGITCGYLLRYPIMFRTGNESEMTLAALQYPYSIDMPNSAGLLGYCVFSVLAMQAFYPFIQI